MEEELLKKRILELRKRAEFTHQLQFTDFLTLSELTAAKSVLNGANYLLFGGTLDTERVMVGIAGSDEKLTEADFPIVTLRIDPQNEKFAQEISHRDVLGSVLGLGLERAVIGDIFVKDKSAFLFCQDKIADFIVQELSQVRHNRVKCSVVSADSQDCERQSKILNKTVSSVRIDAVTAAAFSESRSSVAGDIPSGKVFLNGKEITAAATLVKEEDVISYRGHGKVKLKEIGGLTKKGKISITLELYQ